MSWINNLTLLSQWITQKCTISQSTSQSDNSFPSYCLPSTLCTIQILSLLSIFLMKNTLKLWRGFRRRTWIKTRNSKVSKKRMAIKSLKNLMVNRSCKVSFLLNATTFRHRQKFTKWYQRSVTRQVWENQVSRTNSTYMSLQDSFSTSWTVKTC